MMNGGRLRGMRMQNVFCGALCGMLLCCAPGAMGQTISSNVSTQVDESSASPANAAVSAYVNAMSAEDIRASHSQSAYGSVAGGGASSAASKGALARTQGALSGQGTLVGQGAHLSAGAFVRTQAGQGALSGRLSGEVLRNRFGTRSASELARYQSMHGQLTTSGKGSPLARATPHSIGPISRIKFAASATPGALRTASGEATTVLLSEQAVYSAGFADSTKGTASISPPDMGTSGPLDWTPSLDFGFRDMTQRTFLNPSLHISPRVGKNHHRRSRTLGNRGNDLRRARPSSSVSPDQTLKSTPPNELGPLTSEEKQINQPLSQP